MALKFVEKNFVYNTALLYSLLEWVLCILIFISSPDFSLLLNIFIETINLTSAFIGISYITRPELDSKLLLLHSFQFSKLNISIDMAERPSTQVTHRPSWVSQVALVVKNLPGNAGDTRDMSSIPGLGRSPGGGNGALFQYCCLENATDRGAWWATVHGVAKSWTRLSNWLSCS